MRAINVWNFIHDHLNKSEPVILLCVVESRGSSPGRPGFKMAVSSNAMSGSIGGGIMEHKFVELAKENLKSYSDDAFLKKQVHNKSAGINQSGMICSGEQTVLLLPVTSNHQNEIQNIIDCLENDNNGLISLTPGKISFSDAGKFLSKFSFTMQSESDWKYTEQIGFSNKLFIIGGGHCALALSALMSSLDFHITVIEEREGLNTLEQNTFAHTKKMVNSFSDLREIVDGGQNVYVVIMTFGYRTDDIAFRALADKEFKYIGILGSKAKMQKMFEDWRNNNLPEKILSNLHAPVGLPINSHTPEEIAISIAGEMIAVKNAL